MNEISVPVLIVGAGPAGLATSLLLSRYGVAHMLIEKYSGTAHTPRAHIVNQRTVEIFRHMGIEDRLLAVGTPQHLMSNNVWSTSLVGLEVARLQTWGTSPDRAADYRKASQLPSIIRDDAAAEEAVLRAGYPRSGGRSRVRGHSVFQSVADRDAMVEHGMADGVEEGYDRLDELVTKLQEPVGAAR